MTAKKITLLLSFSNSLTNNFYNLRKFAIQFPIEEKWDFPKISRKRPDVMNTYLEHTLNMYE